MDPIQQWLDQIPHDRCPVCGLDCGEVRQIAERALAAIIGLEAALKKADPRVVLVGDYLITKARLERLMQHKCGSPEGTGS